MTHQHPLKLVMKLLDKLPTWLVLLLSLLVMSVLTLYSLGIMGWLPFDLPGLESMTNMAGTTVLGDEPSAPDSQPPQEGSPTEPSTDFCQVHFIDVGQGDCTLIVTEEKAVLIDAGEYEYGQKVCDYIKALGIKQLDLVIGTHPHSDHVGGLGTVLAQIRTTELMLPEVPDELVPTTSVYERLFDRMENHNIAGVIAEPGLTYDLGSGAVLTVLGPVPEEERAIPYEGLNDYSVVCRLDCGEKAFLFTGDMEILAEEDLMRAGADLSADVLKMGHHGSSTSSGNAFLDAVSPEIGVISCGAGNDYGHPHREIRAAIEERKMQSFRTDRQGSIVLTCDGSSITAQVEKEG